MVALSEKYGTRHIFFSDEAITPKNLRAFPPLLESMGTPFHWGGCARFEAVISGELLELDAAGRLPNDPVWSRKRV